MGIKHGREYKEISAELGQALSTIQDAFEFFEMDQSDWSELTEEQQAEVLETLADDVFYALTEDEAVQVGSGTVTYHAKHHYIDVTVAGKSSVIVRLV